MQGYVSKAQKRIIPQVVYGLLCMVFWGSCKKDALFPNVPPDTRVSLDTIALSGKNRLPTEVRLSWYGTDEDGFVAGYYYSFDQTLWHFTKAQDSTFKFDIAAGNDSADIHFYLKATDNQGLSDPTPAYLRIPIRNTPPVVSFDEKTFPQDTVRLVTTFRWSYRDVDGYSTVKKAFLRVNNGDWTEIDRSKIFISLIPLNRENAGNGSAEIYYDNQTSPAVEKLNGFNNQGNNVFYLKVVDQSGSESVTDTSKTVFVLRKQSDLLMLNGQPSAINAKYRQCIGNVYTRGFDPMDLTVASGKNQPKFWSPTFNLLINCYPKVFVNSDQSAFTDPTTGITLTLLEFMAPAFQQFNNRGGKSFITTSFQNKADVTALKGPFPIDSVSKANGQALISNDSTIYSTVSGYPVLMPSNLVLGCDPHAYSPDAADFYRAKLTPLSGWNGPKTIASRRIKDSKVQQVFFSVELHLFDKNPIALEQLYDQILNTDLN